MTAARRLAALLLLAAAAPAPAQPPELKRVLVLVAAEVSDPELARMVAIDQKSFRGLLAEHLPGDRVVVRELSGKALTATNVLRHYRDLKVEPTDALVFYYTGHGSYRRAGKAGPAGDLHTLELQYDPMSGISPEALTRKELKAAMLAKKAGLTVLLTDCCSDHVEAPAPQDHKLHGVLRAGGKEPTAIGRSLFLTARGVVDMTAATHGQVAVCDTQVGSYFTAALRNAARDKRDEPVDWRTFARTVVAETQDVYTAQARKPGNEELAKNVRAKRLQVPETFELPAARPATAAAPGGKTTYAVVALDNPTSTPLTVQVRWGTTAEWSKPFIAQANKFSFSYRPQPAGRPAETTFQVKVNGEVKTLKAKLVTKDGKPDRAEEGNVYELPSCKPVTKPAGKTRGAIPDDDTP